MKSSSELEGFREQCSAEPTVNFLEGCAKPVLRLWCRAIVAEGYTPARGASNRVCRGSIESAWGHGATISSSIPIEVSDPAETA